MKKYLLLVVALSLSVSCKKQNDDLNDGLYADIQTNKGEIILKLDYDKVPNTVANFVTLTEGKNPFVDEKFKGKPFYDGLKFHRVMSDFMIQGGDPMGDGSGGPGYKFKDEFHPDLKHSKPGILSMANAGPGTNGSQFFITHKETPWLDNRHSVFGEVVKGQEVVDSIAQNDIIEKVTIIRKGKDANAFDAVKTFKEFFSKEAEELKKIAQKVEAAKIEKAKEIKELKETGTKTNSGLIYTFIEKGEGIKPKKGAKVYINYAGFLENGELFDTSSAFVAENCGKLDNNKAAANAYLPFPFDYGNKQGLINGFIEALELMNYNDKIRVFIPSKLGYGAQGAGNVIPPNTNIVFEIELLENLPNQQ